MGSARLTAALAAVVAVATLTACTSTDTTKPAATQVDMTNALTTDAELTFWTWVPNIQKTVDLFTAKYPKVKVKVVNAGGGENENTKLQTVLKGGTGAPDVVQLSYHAIANFAAAKALEPLSPYGAGNLKDKFFPAAWSSVSYNGEVYAIPQDFGPQVMFYRKDIFDKAGIAPPTTWDEYMAAARKLRSALPDVSMTFIDPAAAYTAEMFLAQASSTSFQATGAHNLTVNLQDAGAKRWADLWSSMVREDLVSVSASWNDAWFKALGAGKYATWIEGAWAPTFMSTSFPNNKGLWRAAPMPQWKAGEAVTGQDASGVAVLARSKHKAAAAAFAQWLDADPEAVKSLNTQSQLFPATVALAHSVDFQNATDPFMGDQQANKIYVAAADAVATKWQWTPYETYTASVFGDTVGKAISAKGDLDSGLAAWQQRIVEYGRQQGFTVTTAQ